MNKKRWFAIGITALIMVASTFSPSYTVESSASAENVDLGLFDSYLSTETEVKEVVLEDGSTDSRILELTLDGVIKSGGGSSFNDDGYNHDFFLEQLELAKNDSTVKAILFVVNTPGGGVFESAEIRRKLMEVQAEGVPIYVTMQAMAASGGYYVSADAEKIFATPETWTGSIGVIMQMMNYKELLEKHGVHVNTFASGDYKDMGSPTSELSAGEKAVFESMIDDSYQRFVDIIVGGRGMSEAKVKKIADGRIYTAAQALDNGLIDQIGYKEDALAALRSDYDLAGSQVFSYQKDSLNEFMKLFSSVSNLPRGMNELNEMRLLLDGYFKNGAPKAYYLYGGQ